MKYFFLLSVIFLYFASCNPVAGDHKQEVSVSAVLTKANLDTIHKLTELLSDSAVLKTQNEKYYHIHREKIAGTALVEEPVIGSPAFIDCSTNKFMGVARKKAKTSFVNTPVSDYSLLKTLLQKLPSDSNMINRKPAISSGPSSGRIKEEKKKVLLSNAYLVAIKREPDEDYHMIITNDSTGKGPFMNTEISGLPDSASIYFNILNKVRTTVEASLGALCDSMYIIFDTPYPLKITGSIFYDIDHAPGTIGPLHYRPSTSWEIHPVTEIIFE